MRKNLIFCALALLGAAGVAESAAAQRAVRPPAAAAVAGFGHAPPFPSELLSLPYTMVRGAWATQYLWIGGPDDFAAWERGGRERPPIDISFVDTSSPQQEDDAGIEAEYTVRENVQPTAYRIDRNRVAFTGRSARLGTIQFEGRFLHPGRTAFEEGDDVAIGTLRVGERRFRNLRLSVAAH